MLKHKLLGATAAAEPVFIEDVFSTYLYTGNGSTQTITNGIDLAGEGGLVWTKNRVSTVAGRNNHRLHDSERGVTFSLVSNTTAAQDNLGSNSISSFNSDGYTLGGTTFNNASDPWVSWTFRKAERFFDVVTYTGDAQASKVINHNLGVAPGFIIVKAYSGASAVSNWYCYHRGVGNTAALTLNLTDAATTAIQYWRNTDPTSTNFTVGSVLNDLNTNFVAYLFAHDPLGPSGDGSDGLIACGSYTGNGSATGPTVSLGWEPQWLMIKRATGVAGNWQIIDNMRGMPVGSNDALLQANLTNAEAATVDSLSPTATGFQIVSTTDQFNNNGSSYIYIAIRRGPMREPTSGTEVFTPLAVSASTSTSVAAPFPPDLVFSKYRTSTTTSSWTDRLRGLAISSANNVATLRSESTAAEVAFAAHNAYYNNNTFYLDSSSAGVLGYFFRRAPGFFDVVAYTGDGVAGRTVSHNLGVAPEMMIFKRRNGARSWAVYCQYVGNGYDQSGNLESTTQFISGVWNNTLPTATEITFSNSFDVNGSGATYIGYLFASLPGISKVGSYTGNGSSQTINCGFTGGARFVLIKRTDSTGDWYVWDTARGIVAGNDPHLSLNTTAAEVTTNDSIDPDSSGFIVNQLAATNINVSSATYIYLAIA